MIYRYLSNIFRAAVDDRVIARSPCVKVTLPRQNRAEVEPLEVAQVEAMAEAVGERYHSLVLLAAGTGLRPSEALGLTIDRVDFLRRRLTVDRQLVVIAGEAPQFGPPKTDASYRTVPLPDVVLEAVSAHLAAFGSGPDGHVFTNDRGEPVRRNRFSELWSRARQTVGLASTVRFHDLRHFYASLLIQHGESVKVVQKRLGHASASETLDTYSHLWPDSEDSTRAAVDLVLGAPADPSRTAEQR